ncbi:uncharacterized protein F4822DRAFT_310863 [Hypoxylon trugodes]|uniref:uncharacterized protein n=1 Tax=Hypoxylon trugodes TaxID=326681 RepID=UPI002194EE7E|nr:uncharacterized protein F4822DRAFT_310863 [Hypoxylon trugodes]KAI1386265.1 hypothetical protein F4822DRAFT_310863 [Hypoxylon trugodes]
MAAPADVPLRDPPPPPPPDHSRIAGIWKRFLGKDNNLSSSIPHIQEPRTSLDSSSPGSGIIRRVSRKVVPGLPRAKTFKRQQSEVREKLEAVEPTSAERRAVSVDRRVRTQRSTSRVSQPLPRASAPDFLDDTQPPLSPPAVVTQHVTSAPQSPLDEKQFLSLEDAEPTAANPDTEQRASLEPVPSHTEALSPVSPIDVQSTTTSQYDAMINDELERKWILNLSMHFRDKSKREKFFVTYREDEYVWRRVTISLDYRNAPDDSLEKDLLGIKFQREKSAKIYEAIRESLQDIQFYSTVTNLKLQTTDGRLHVHVVEDINEIINYPTVRMIQHLKCHRIKERDLVFDAHMSGFVYKVRVGNQTLIKKEIPGPDTVDEFLYEVNALNSLQFSRNVIEFYGVVVDENDSVKGLLINYAEKGALIDVIYDTQEEGHPLPWSIREKWARQIVQGLSDVHEAGFVQGDLTLSNIVIDYEDNAKIIDINRRGCPVGWEPPEATPLIDSNQRISMYIGVKSDLYQLGMVLWALATLEDEPEAHRRPLRLEPEIEVPGWYRTIVEHCLHEDPRVRLQATVLLRYFPQPAYDDDYDRHDIPSISVEDEFSRREYMVDSCQQNGYPQVKTVQPRNAWPYAPFDNTHNASPAFSDDPYYYPSRGRSPPRSLPSNHDMYGPPYMGQHEMWPNDVGPPYVGPGDVWSDDVGPPYVEGLELPLNEVIDLSDDIDLEDEKAETPRRAQAAEEIVAKVQKELDQLEAKEAPTTDGENQAEGATSAPSASDASSKADDEFEKGLSLPNDITAVVTPIKGPTATSTLGEGQPQGSLQPEFRNKLSELAEAAQPGEAADVDTAVASAPLQNGTVIQPVVNGDEGGFGDGGSEPFNHYTHDRREDIPMRSTEAPSPGTAESQPNDLPAELKGIGDGYGKQEHYRMSFTDEDLGLSTPAMATNVT